MVLELLSITLIVFSTINGNFACVIPNTCHDVCIPPPPPPPPCMDCLPLPPFAGGNHAAFLDHINQKQDLALEGLKIGMNDHENLMQRFDDVEDRMDGCRRSLKKSRKRVDCLTTQVQDTKQLLKDLQCQDTVATNALFKKLEILPKTYCALQETNKKITDMSKQITRGLKSLSGVSKKMAGLKLQLNEQRKSQAVMSTQLQLLMLNDKTQRDMLNQVKTLSDSASKTAQINGMKANQMMCRILRLGQGLKTPCPTQTCTCSK